MTNVTAQIASHLGRTVDGITEVREWAFVYWVRFATGRPTLVSKKVVVAQPAPFVYTMNSDRSRRKPWAAKITGLSNDQYVLSRVWLTPSAIEWNKKGCESATFEITEQGIYQDQDTGYFQVYVEDGELTYREISQDEAVWACKVAATQAQIRQAHPAAVGLF